LPELAARYPELGIVVPGDFDFGTVEGVRDAKGFLNRQMGQGSYKPTRDQAKYVYSLDFAKLAIQSRSFRHLCGCIDFLCDPNSELVYPVPPVV
jgi:hypothetical protein